MENHRSKQNLATYCYHSAIVIILLLLSLLVLPKVVTLSGFFSTTKPSCFWIFLILWAFTESHKLKQHQHFNNRERKWRKKSKLHWPLSRRQLVSLRKTFQPFPSLSLSCYFSLAGQLPKLQSLQETDKQMNLKAKGESLKSLAFLFRTSSSSTSCLTSLNWSLTFEIWVYWTNDSQLHN